MGSLLGLVCTYCAQTINDEFFEYARHFLDTGSPMFVSLFFTAALLFVLTVFIKGIIIPERRRHRAEKKELEFLNAKKIALLIEMNPDPVIKVDKNFSLIFSNAAANNIIHPDGEEETDIKDLVCINHSMLEEIITNNKISYCKKELNSRTYAIHVTGSSELNEAHIYFHDITDIINFEKELVKSRERLNKLSNHVQDIIENERGRIASELHDSIGQKLLMGKLLLDKITKHETSGDIYSEINKVTDEINSTINELKEISYSLKPKYLSEIGLGPALNSLCQRISSESNIKNIIFIENPDERYAPNVELTIYRIAQEALNNILKHSEASEFNLQLLQNDNRVKLMISDNGKGFDTELEIKGKGFGLLNMKQRAENIGGSFKVDSSEEYGTLIVTEIPVA